MHDDETAWEAFLPTLDAADLANDAGNDAAKWQRDELWLTLTEAEPPGPAAIGAPPLAAAGPPCAAPMRVHRTWQAKRLVPLGDVGGAFDRLGRPLNPYEPRLKEGLLLPRWGPNHTVATLVTRGGGLDGILETLVCLSGETGRVGIPRSTLGPSTCGFVARDVQRAFGASAYMAISSQLTSASIVSTGYVVGQHNTLHAWRETICVHAHLAVAAFTDTLAGARARWVTVTDDMVSLLCDEDAAMLRTALDARRWDMTNLVYDERRDYRPPPRLPPMLTSGSPLQESDMAKVHRRK